MEPNYQTKNGKLYIGNSIDVLKQLPDESVSMCVTSPPFWGLRDYGTATWEGGDENCDHLSDRSKYEKGFEGSKQATNSGTKNRDIIQHKECPKCGAKRVDNQIGLESTPEEYVANMVKVFREVRRVLRDDGTVWLNLGDSYWGGKGQSGQGSPEYQANRQDVSINRPYHQVAGPKQTRPSDGKHPTLKPKDLVGIPWRVAFALQKDGWYLRSDIIWQKLNPMPESVTDRPTKSHEYIFLLSKSKKYYYDYEAIKERSLTPTSKSGTLKKNASEPTGKISAYNHSGEDFVTSTTRNKRSVWTVNTKPFKGAHFAVFPPDLIKPCILAGCQKDGTGTVLDPFMGSGTTALVCESLNLHWMGIELNTVYANLLKKRVSPYANISRIKGNGNVLDNDPI